MINGYLNELASSKEKFGNNKGNSTRYNKFNNILDGNGCFNIEFTGLPYTWFNKWTLSNCLYNFNGLLAATQQ